MFFTDLAAQPLEDEPRWPEAGGRRVALLVDASSPLERRLVEAWAERARPEARDHSADQWVSIPASRKRRPTQMDPRLEDAVAADPYGPSMTEWRKEVGQLKTSVTARQAYIVAKIGD